MLILEDNIINYIFLSREVPLPLSFLKILKMQQYPIDDILNLSSTKFRTLLTYMNQNYRLRLRKIDDKIQNFARKNNKITFSKIQNELKICEDNGIKCLSYFDNNFPYLLKQINPSVKLVFIKGELKAEDSKAVAIIGTRNPTTYGKKMAHDIAKRFVELNFTIISGFARGVDTIAIESALDNGGRAIGVLPSGILNIYPKENINLAERMEKNGVLISEKFPLKSVDRRALQIRNRITSGLALGNVFVEGKRDSGTKWQLKYGKQQLKPSIAVKPVGDYEQAHVPNIIINEEKGAIISEIDDVDVVAESLLEEYKKKNKPIKTQKTQTNIFNF